MISSDPKFHSKRLILILIILITLTLVLQACGYNDQVISLSAEDAKRFDLKAETKAFLLETEIENRTVLQSFAFDNVNEHLYVVQVMEGGLQLEGESFEENWNRRQFNGDLTLTQLDYDGNQLGYMYLKGFGHGVSIGIEMEDEVPYIWAETDSVNDGERGWGRQLIRFPFENETIIDSKRTELEKYALITTSDHTTVNIDQAHHLLTLRYRFNGAYRFAVYNLEDIHAGTYEPMYDVAQPDDIQTFQGFASYGKYLYLLEGNSFEHVRADDEVGNTYITVLDLTTGEVVDKQFMNTGLDLLFREPEGMAISIPNPDRPDLAILNFGFASTVSETDTSKLINIFSIDQMVEEDEYH